MWFEDEHKYLCCQVDVAQREQNGYTWCQHHGSSMKSCLKRIIAIIQGHSGLLDSANNCRNISVHADLKGRLPQLESSGGNSLMWDQSLMSQCFTFILPTLAIPGFIILSSQYFPFPSAGFFLNYWLEILSDSISSVGTCREHPKRIMALCFLSPWKATADFYIL